MTNDLCAQNNFKNNPSHGGRRKGSGRKTAEEPRKPYCFRLTEEEHDIVKEFIKNLKKGSK